MPRVYLTNWQRLCCDWSQGRTRPGEVQGLHAYSGVQAPGSGKEEGQAMCVLPLWGPAACPAQTPLPLPPCKGRANSCHSEAPGPWHTAQCGTGPPM